MPLICIQCSMRALLKDMPTPTFEETNEEHMARMHPNPMATKLERLELEERLADKLWGGKK
jgi:hypothetical protein